MSKLSVEDFESLDGLSYDKLRKLLDVATDYRDETRSELIDANRRVSDIIHAMDKIHLLDWCDEFFGKQK